MAKVSFIGLGVTGFPMAGHLQRAGRAVTVWNRTREKAERWRERHGGALARTPREAAGGAELVFTCVGQRGGCRLDDSSLILDAERPDRAS